MFFHLRKNSRRNTTFVLACFFERIKEGIRGKLKFSISTTLVLEDTKAATGTCSVKKMFLGVFLSRNSRCSG